MRRGGGVLQRAHAFPRDCSFLNYNSKNKININVKTHYYLINKKIHLHKVHHLPAMIYVMPVELIINSESIEQD